MEHARDNARVVGTFYTTLTGEFDIEPERAGELTHQYVHLMWDGISEPDGEANG